MLESICNLQNYFEKIRNQKVKKESIEYELVKNFFEKRNEQDYISTLYHTMRYSQCDIKKNEIVIELMLKKSDDDYYILENYSFEFVEYVEPPEDFSQSFPDKEDFSQSFPDEDEEETPF